MQRFSFSSCGTAVVALCLITIPVVSHAGITPEAKCQAGKNDAAGKYASCLGKAEMTAVLTEDPARYAAAVTKCQARQLAAWGKLEAAAVAAGTTCPTTDDQAPIVDFIDACGASIAGALQEGGALPLDVVSCNSDLTTCSTDLGTCSTNLGTCSSERAIANASLAACASNLSTTNADLGTCSANLTVANSDLADCEADLSTTTAGLASCVAVPDALPLKTGLTTCYASSGSVTPCAGTNQDGETRLGVARAFIDNGDGTITDTATGLMWEKLSNDGSIHDKDTSYTWGAAFSSKIATLNTDGFAGHTDWRLPNVLELQTLLSYGADTPATYAEFSSACPGLCTFATCSCTASDWYWSSTSYVANPPYKWAVNFVGGEVTQLGQSGSPSHVRAVRTL